jgi:hypothetical protein
MPAEHRSQTHDQLAVRQARRRHRDEPPVMQLVARVGAVVEGEEVFEGEEQLGGAGHDSHLSDARTAPYQILRSGTRSAPGQLLEQ